MSNNLIELGNLSPTEVFPSGIDNILARIESEARSWKLDMSTDKGRKEIASLAYKIAKSKTALDELGKSLVADWKEKAAKVDAARKKARDTLDALKEEIRKPLTDWEDKEKLRVAKHQEDLHKINMLGDEVIANWYQLSIKSMKNRLNDLDNHQKNWEEFNVDAILAKEATRNKIIDAINRKEIHQKEQEELAILRAEKLKCEEEEKIKIINPVSKQEASKAEDLAFFKRANTLYFEEKIKDVLTDIEILALQNDVVIEAKVFDKQYKLLGMFNNRADKQDEAKDD